MKFENTLKIIKENSLNESISIDNVDSFVGQLIKEGIVKSAVKKICYTAPLKTASGYVFSAKKEDSKIKIHKNFVEAKDHPVITEITQEVIDDILSQFGEDGIDMIVDLLKRDLYIDQDKDLFSFINSIATPQDDISLPAEDFEAALVRLQGYIDQLTLEISEKVKSPMGSVIIGSPNLIGLLIRESDRLSKREDLMYSYAGSIGNRDLFVDYDATDDYITVGISGEDTLRGVVYSPYNIATNFHTSYEDGSKVVRVNNRYVFSRNPLDEEQDGIENSIFFRKTNISFNGAFSLEDFTTAFNAEITPEIDPE